MVNYYYLVSSLPSLSSDAPMPFSYEEFVGMCKSAVNKRVLSDLENLTLKSENGAFLKKWGAFYRKLQDAVNRQRRLNLGKAAQKDEERDFNIDRIAGEALSAKNPYEAEKVLLKAQFDYLDSLTSMHNFDDYVLFGYAVKLKLLERQNVFSRKAGKDEFSRLFDGIQKDIQSLSL